jgi:hypothetical protein
VHVRYQLSNGIGIVERIGSVVDGLHVCQPEELEQLVRDEEPSCLALS